MGESKWELRDCGCGGAYHGTCGDYVYVGEEKDSIDDLLKRITELEADVAQAKQAKRGEN